VTFREYQAHVGVRRDRVNDYQIRYSLWARYIQIKAGKLKLGEFRRKKR